MCPSLTKCGKLEAIGRVERARVPAPATATTLTSNAAESSRRANAATTTTTIIANSTSTRGVATRNSATTTATLTLSTRRAVTVTLTGRALAVSTERTIATTTTTTTTVTTATATATRRLIALGAVASGLRAHAEDISDVDGLGALAGANNNGGGSDGSGGGSLGGLRRGKAELGSERGSSLLALLDVLVERELHLLGLSGGSGLSVSSGLLLLLLRGLDSGLIAVPAVNGGGSVLIDDAVLDVVAPVALTSTTLLQGRTKNNKLINHRGQEQSQGKESAWKGRAG